LSVDFVDLAGKVAEVAKTLRPESLKRREDVNNNDVLPRWRERSGGAGVID
jgi:hypothetical protein